MKKNRTSLGQLFDNNNFLVIFSVVAAILSWLIVAMAIDPARSEIVRRVPVNLSFQAAALSNLGLNVIEGGDNYVDVRVSGPLTVVGQLRPEQILTTARVAGITEPGSYQLDVIPISQGTNLDFEILEYLPSKVTVKLDRIGKKDFDIVDKPNGLAYADSFVEGTKTISPGKVTVTGPESELDKIMQCIVTTELSAPLSDTFSQELPLVFLDAKGDPVDLAERQLKSDTEAALLVVYEMPGGKMAAKDKRVSCAAGQHGGEILVQLSQLGDIGVGIFTVVWRVFGVGENQRVGNGLYHLYGQLRIEPKMCVGALVMVVIVVVMAE